MGSRRLRFLFERTRSKILHISIIIDGRTTIEVIYHFNVAAIIVWRGYFSEVVTKDLMLVLSLRISRILFVIRKVLVIVAMIVVVIAMRRGCWGEMIILFSKRNTHMFEIGSLYLILRGWLRKCGRWFLEVTLFGVHFLHEFEISMSLLDCLLCAENRALQMLFFLLNRVLFLRHPLL